MRYIFQNYISRHDWRLAVIEFLSLVLAVLSAFLLEAKFFQLFIPDDRWAITIAVTVVFSVTFVAHAAAYNLQKRKREGKSYKFLAFVLSISYISVVISLFGMSNYTMAVSKVEKDAVKLDIKIASVDSLPKIIQARHSLKVAEANFNADIAKIKLDQEDLRKREKETGSSFVTKKQVYDDMILRRTGEFKAEQREFNTLREKEEQRLIKDSMKKSNTGKNDGSIGAFLANNPAALPLLALVILFLGKLSFDPIAEKALTKLEPMAQVESREETHSHKVVVAKGEIPVSQLPPVQTPKSFDPETWEAACIFIRQGKLDWSERDVVRKFPEVSRYKVREKLKSLPLQSKDISQPVSTSSG